MSKQNNNFKLLIDEFDNKIKPHKKLKELSIKEPVINKDKPLKITDIKQKPTNKNLF